MYNSRNNLIIGFHGCDESTQQALLTNPDMIRQSAKPYDWLGHGIYFWENNYDRALQWAKEKEKRKEITKAAVIGATLSLDKCLDLTDSGSINLLISYFEVMQKQYQTMGWIMPENKDAANDKNKGLLIRELDCAVIEFMHDSLKDEVAEDIKKNGFSELNQLDSVRGLFAEGGPAFSGAGIQKKNHLQICIRNKNCIKGFFLPRKESKWPA